jgi:hypothetical protein
MRKLAELRETRARHVAEMQALVAGLDRDIERRQAIDEMERRSRTFF